MASTPPPPSRLNTPPTPLHGPKHDAYEPYSTRRSSRISSQKIHSSTSGDASAPATTSKTASSKALARRVTMKRTSSQTFSPPSSPISPERCGSPRQHTNKDETVVRGSVPNRGAGMSYDQSSAASRTFRHGIPTPSKTPRKKGINTTADFTSTARVLFPTHHSTATDDVVPTPRRARRNRDNILALDDLDNEARVSDIQVYTDSRERVPESVIGEDNPFRTRRSYRTSALPRTGLATKYGMTKEIDAAVERGEGIVYVFRGKKVFRKFADEEEASQQGREGQLVSDNEVLRQSGAFVHRAAARTDIKPRRLFAPPPPPSRTIDADEEEAVTDIETGESLPVKLTATSTPRKQIYRPATPPTTVKKDRSSAEHSMPSRLHGTDEREDAIRTNSCDEWQSTKRGLGKRLHDAASAGDHAVVNGTKGKRAKKVISTVALVS